MNDYDKKYLIDFLDECEECLDACVRKETRIVKDEESSELGYENAPNLYLHMQKLKEKYQVLPAYYPGYSHPVGKSLKHLMARIEEMPHLKREWLLEIYLTALCLAMESDAITLTKLETYYSKEVHGLSWTNSEVDFNKCFEMYEFAEQEGVNATI